MSKAKILNGIWTRKVTWERNGEWRTDILKTVLSDPRLRECRFILKGGPEVLIPAEELRRLLVGGHDHYEGGKIWGPFNIDPAGQTVDGHKVRMEVL